MASPRVSAPISLLWCTLPGTTGGNPALVSKVQAASMGKGKGTLELLDLARESCRRALKSSMMQSACSFQCRDTSPSAWETKASGCTQTLAQKSFTGSNQPLLGENPGEFLTGRWVNPFPVCLGFFSSPILGKPLSCPALTTWGLGKCALFIRLLIHYTGKKWMLLGCRVPHCLAFGMPPNDSPSFTAPLYKCLHSVPGHHLLSLLHESFVHWLCSIPRGVNLCPLLPQAQLHNQSPTSCLAFSSLLQPSLLGS